MEIDGWRVRVDDEGNLFRTSHLRPKTHYLATLLKDYAIDIEFRKEEIDALPEEERNKEIIKAFRKIVNDLTITSKSK